MPARHEFFNLYLHGTNLLATLVTKMTEARRQQTAQPMGRGPAPVHAYRDTTGYHDTSSDANAGHH